jgi:stage V sporulation protein AC
MNYENLEISKEEYVKYVEQKSNKSPIFKNIFFAFISGGIICLIGEFITNLFINFEFEEKLASTMSVVILIFLGAFLTSINLYSKIGKYAGAGSIVPITGFSNSIVAPAIEYKSEGFILGLGSNMFKIAGPVLVYGIVFSVLIGFIYYIKGLVM